MEWPLLPLPNGTMIPLYKEKVILEVIIIPPLFYEQNAKMIIQLELLSHSDLH